ncbi:MAG: dipeptidase [Sphingopyxis sp.]
MKRIAKYTIIVVALLLAAFFVFAPRIADSGMNKVTGTHARAGVVARALHADMLVADLHADTLLWDRDLTQSSSRGHVDLPRLGQGNVALQVFSSVSQTPWGLNYNSNANSDNLWALAIAQQQPMRTWFSPLERTLYHGEKLRRAVRDANGRLMPILRRSDVAALIDARAHQEAATGVLFSVEGLQNLEGDFANLDRLYRAGVRMAGLVHFFDNEVAGSMHGVAKGGLTPLGRRVVAAMERRGMIIDIAHSSHATVAEVLAIATRPVVSSHGGVQATCRTNRNLSDDEIRGVARTGGVIGIGVWEGAVCSTDPRATARAMRHVRDLVGINHVALGSDYDGATSVAYDVSRLSLITQALLDEGFSEADIRLAMGGNTLRVLAQALPER